MTNTPKTFGEMTPEEKGALLLAEHEGREIEMYLSLGEWIDIEPHWASNRAYRVKPEAKTVTTRICIAPNGFSKGMAPEARPSIYSSDCHHATLTFQLKPDGTADWSTAKLEALE